MARDMPKELQLESLSVTQHRELEEGQEAQDGQEGQEAQEVETDKPPAPENLLMKDDKDNGNFVNFNSKDELVAAGWQVVNGDDYTIEFEKVTAEQLITDNSKNTDDDNDSDGGDSGQTATLMRSKFEDTHAITLKKKEHGLSEEELAEQPWKNYPFDDGLLY